jgi:hypothetical protein
MPGVYTKDVLWPWQVRIGWANELDRFHLDSWLRDLLGDEGCSWIAFQDGYLFRELGSATLFQMTWGYDQ